MSSFNYRHTLPIIPCLFIALFSKVSHAQDTLRIISNAGDTARFEIRCDPDHESEKKRIYCYFTVKPDQIALEKNYLNGRQNGWFKKYDLNGQLREFGIYGNGKKYGEWTWYDAKGEIIVKGKYKENLKHGYWAFLKENCFGRYKKGEKHGKWICYSNGQIIKTSYKNGIQVKPPIPGK